MFADAAVTTNRCRVAEKKYQDYRKSQDARIYNHPGHDARQVLIEKLHTLRVRSNMENERFTHIVADMGTLPSHHLLDVVAYNEHNHLTAEALAEEKRRGVVIEAEKKLDEMHNSVDRDLTILRTRLDQLAKEKEATEVLRNLPQQVDPNEMAVEEAAASHRGNGQRIVVVEVRSGSTDPFVILIPSQNSLQTIASVEDTSRNGGPNQIFEDPTSGSLQLQEFAESIAMLIRLVPLIREETAAIKSWNEKRKATGDMVSSRSYGVFYPALNALLAVGNTRPTHRRFLRTA